MHFRTGKYDAHPGQKKPMHQITIRMGQTDEAELKRLFGEELKVTLVRSSPQSLIFRRRKEGERGHHIGPVKGTDQFGLTVPDTHHSWLQLISPGWTLSDCSYKRLEDGIEFFFPALRRPPTKMSRGQRDESAPAPAARPLEETGSVLLDLPGKTLVSRNIPVSKIEGVMRFLGGEWE